MEYKKSTYKKPYKKNETTKAVYKPKRGKLSKLMTEEEKQNAGIHGSTTCGITDLRIYGITEKLRTMM